MHEGGVRLGGRSNHKGNSEERGGMREAVREGGEDI